MQTQRNSAFLLPLFEPDEKGGVNKIQGYFDYKGRYFSGIANLDALHYLETELQHTIERVIVFQRLPDDAICSTKSFDEFRAAIKILADFFDTSPPFNPATPKSGKTKANAESEVGGRAIVGIIDEGIAFANERFRKSACETRVEYFWMQDGACRCNEQKNSQNLFLEYGREFTKLEIDQLLKKHTSDGKLDEDYFYADIGLLDFNRSGHKAAAFRASHGTHIADIACGFDPGASLIEGTNDDTFPIFCVQLPTRTVADTSGLGLEKYMVDGVQYILDQAKKWAEEKDIPRPPVIINFSSNVFAGPHDGTLYIERAVKGLLNEYSTEIKGYSAPAKFVVPSGNNFLLDTHAKVTLPPNESSNDGKGSVLNWQVQPDDKTFSFMEIWLPNGANGDISIELTPPFGETSLELSSKTSDKPIKWVPNQKDILCKAYYEEFLHTDSEMDTNSFRRSSRGRFVIIIAPTAPTDNPVPLAPAGRWEVKLINKSSASQTVHAWIQWDDRPITYPITGRQSYFVDENHKQFDFDTGRMIEEDVDDSVIKRFGTINALATCDEFITVGGFMFNDFSNAYYSAAGDCESEPPIPYPDVSAVTDDSYVHGGILGAGSKTGSVVALNGTSVAAPQVARFIASVYADDPMADIEQILHDLARANENHIDAVLDQDHPHNGDERHNHPNPQRPETTKNRIGDGRLASIYPMSARLSQSLRR